MALWGGLALSFAYFCFAIAVGLIIVQRRIIRRGRHMAKDNRIERERKQYDGNDVTVLKKMGKTTQIRDQFGFVQEVPTKELRDIDDPERATVTVAKNPDGW